MQQQHWCDINTILLSGSHSLGRVEQLLGQTHSSSASGQLVRLYLIRTNTHVPSITYCQLQSSQRKQCEFQHKHISGAVTTFCQTSMRATLLTTVEAGNSYDGRTKVLTNLQQRPVSTAQTFNILVTV